MKVSFDHYDMTLSQAPQLGQFPRSFVSIPGRVLNLAFPFKKANIEVVIGGVPHIDFKEDADKYETEESTGADDLSVCGSAEFEVLEDALVKRLVQCARK